MMKKTYVKTVKIIIPWWMKFLKRFIRLEIKPVINTESIRGYSYDTVIIDDISMVEKNIDLRKGG